MAEIGIFVGTMYGNSLINLSLFCNPNTPSGCERSLTDSVGDRQEISEYLKR